MLDIYVVGSLIYTQLHMQSKVFCKIHGHESKLSDIIEFTNLIKQNK